MILNKNWDNALKDEFEKGYFKDLMKKIEDEYSTEIIHPDKDEIFNAYKYTDLNEIKAVILGQDPYHGPGQAHGLSFSVKRDLKKLPPSLKNIYKELYNDLNVPICDHGELISWAKQGVFLLNTVLTVKEHKAASHAGIGWEVFTDKTIEIINENDKPVVFMLWGNDAGKKEALITSKRHLVLKAPHPSPLAAYRGFFGCGHFGKCNQFLRDNNITEIDWKLK